MRRRINFILFFFFLSLTTSVGAQSSYLHIPTVLHISSTASDGKHTLEEAVKIARDNGAAAIVFGDHYAIQAEYGLWPLRNIFKKGLSRNSVSHMGTDTYLAKIAEVQKKFPQMLVLPGIEVTPHYFWSGDPFKKDLMMMNWHKHILVFGLDAEGFKHLPVISNKDSSAWRFSLLELLLPLTLFLVGGLCMRRRKIDYRKLLGGPRGPFSKVWRIIGMVMIFLGIGALIVGFPFKEPKYNPYIEEATVEPYQDLINYVNEKGGISFWAHPEVGYNTTLRGVRVMTDSYAKDLLRTHNYTGFAYFYEGVKEIGIPNGIWDRALRQYCERKRTQPVWAIGELDFEQTGNLQYYVQDLKTVVLAEEHSAASLLDAIQKGRMYLVRGLAKFNPVLDNFSVVDPATGNQALMGEELITSSAPIIRVRSHHNNKGEEPAADAKIRLIRNGKIIQIWDLPSPFELEFQDDSLSKNKLSFYRLEIYYPYKTVISNPIFVRFRY